MLPLTGTKVVEIAQNIAGPYGGEILAMLGADVLKIERPQGGDDARGWGPPFIDGMATTFHTVNRNKRAITLDLKDPEGVAWLKRYLSEADVLVQNMRPGSLDELGLGAETLRAANPRLIYCSLWAFGHKGPMRSKGGYEPMIQAAAGMFSMNGQEGGPPTRVGMQVLDLGTGVWAALGTLAALIEREKTGRGCVVDTSLYETALGWLSVHFAGFLATGEHPVRHGSGNPRVVVFQSFVTADGEIVIAAANDRLFRKFVAELGHPEWGEDARFQTNALRVANKAAIIPQIARILLEGTMQTWLDRLEEAGIPCAPIKDLHDVKADPHLAALELLQQLPGMELKTVGLPVSFDGVRPTVHRRAPRLGEHNREMGLDVAETVSAT
jgi:crotonobetainyl-CoA:carnitine CoA-transferase CaiB-like acyl-CoA transferase